jgi:hypothetical protein
VLQRVLVELSCRRYRECAAAPEALGMSASSVSRRFIRASARKPCDLQGHRLERHDFVALVLGGKALQADELVIALGITSRGQKVLLGFMQAATEKCTVCAAFLRELVARGLRYEQGPSEVVDGSKGLRAAVSGVLGPSAQVQRWQRDKRENVVAHLPKSQQTPRAKLQRAYYEHLAYA